MKPLSFVIITYDRPADMLELAQNIASLKFASELLEEVIIVNNQSAKDYSNLKTFIAATPSIPFRYYEAPSNLGVSGGRNFAFDKGKAPVIIMLDDDAVLQNKDSLLLIKEAFEKNRTSRPVAIVSFKVLYYENLRMQVNAFPHKEYDQKKGLLFFETYYYAGGAHAIKREVLEKVGTYPEDFFYGMEEYDLSYRIINQGYSIIYDSGIVMLHKESPLGRKPKNEKLQMMWVNKAKVAWRYLPKRNFYTTAAMWSLQYLRITGFNLKGFFNGWKQIRKIASYEKRAPVGNDAMNYLRKTNARLWY